MPQGGVVVRVLMLSWEYPPHVVGGLGRHVAGLSRALADGFAQVLVVTCANEGPEEEVHGDLEVVRVRFGEPAGLHFPESVAQRNAGLLQGVLRRVGSGWRPDVVHAHDWLTAYAARAVKHAFDIPLIATLHATEFGRNRGLYTDLQRHISDIEWWLAFEAWRVICCSEAMRSELRTIFQLPLDKIRVIPNGVDFPERREDAARIAAVRRRFAGDGEKLLFFVGRLVYEKGVDLILRALPRVLERHPQTVLVVSGRGPEEGGLKRLAQELGVGERVRFTGYISDDDRNTLYQAADVAVFPSRYEPFGIVALEAMAFGLPVVAARVGGLAEVIDADRTGLLFEADNPWDLAERLGEALSNPGLRASLAENARRLVASEYHWARVAERTADVYRELLAEKAQGRAHARQSPFAAPVGVESAGSAYGYYR